MYVMKYRIVEIFSSIEGEGKRTGQLAAFIRLAGCNLGCSYCDTPYAQNFSAGQDMDLEQILKILVDISNDNVTLTGGEPLANPHTDKLIEALIGIKKEVNIETNGSYPIGPYLNYPSTFLTMDWKTPSSGCCKYMLPENLALLREQDVLKIVMEEQDFEAVSDLLQATKIKSYIYLSPVFGLLDPKLLVDFAKKLSRFPTIDTKKMHVQVQLHKIIWDPEARGV